MKQFLLASHGKFAEGILGSFQMILGDAPNITVLCAYTKENEETLEHTVKKIICERNRKEVSRFAQNVTELRAKRN